MNKKSSLSERKVDSREKVVITKVTAFSPDECYSHFQNSMELLRKQLKVADNLINEGNEEDCKNIWRSQIVFLDGILDFYIHELTKFGIQCMFLGQWSKTKQYNSMRIPMCVVEEGLRLNSTSCDWLLKHTVEKIGRDTYLSYDSIKDQLNLIGISLIDILDDTFYSIDPCKKTKRKDGKDKGKAWITELFKRRNQIAHQMDRSLIDASENDISKEYVEEFIKKVELLVEKIHEKASNLSAQSIET